MAKVSASGKEFARALAKIGDAGPTPNRATASAEFPTTRRSRSTR